MMNALSSAIQGDQMDPLSALKILLEQQSSLTAQLAVAERQLRESQMNAELKGGADRTATRALVVRSEERVAELRQNLEILRERIASTQDVLRSAPVGVALGQEPDQIFMLKPAEFYSTSGFLLLLPLVLALARRIWRSGSIRPRRDHTTVGDPQIARLQQAVEAIAIEVERISEAQRFSAKLMAERPKDPVIERIKGQRRVVTPLP